MKQVNLIVKAVFGLGYQSVAQCYLLTKFSDYTIQQYENTSDDHINKQEDDSSNDHTLPHNKQEDDSSNDHTLPHNKQEDDSSNDHTLSH